MMVTSIQLSYSVSTVGLIIDGFSSHEKSRKIRAITNYMNNKKIGYKLKYKYIIHNKI